jgi:hypothetical protein
MKERKFVDFIAAIVSGILGLIIVNTVPLWLHLTHGVILESWRNILWAANLSMIAQLAGNIFLAIYRPARLYSFIQAILAMASLVSVIVFYVVFPLDFSLIAGNWLNILTKAVLILAMFGSSLAIIIYLVRAVTGTRYKQA